MSAFGQHAGVSHSRTGLGEEIEWLAKRKSEADKARAQLETEHGFAAVAHAQSYEKTAWCECRFTHGCGESSFDRPRFGAVCRTDCRRAQRC